MKNGRLFNHDLKHLARPRGSVRRPRPHAAVMGFFTVSLSALAVALLDGEMAARPVAALDAQAGWGRQEISVTREDGSRYQVDSAAVPGPAPARPAPEEGRQTTLTIQSGDTLDALLTGRGIRRRDIFRLTNTAGGEVLHRLRPGAELRLRYRDDGTLLQLSYQATPRADTLIARRATDAEGHIYLLQQVSRQLEVRNRYVAGTIDRSLYVAGREVGLSDALIMALVEIFGWDIDFALDLRAGDRFAVIFEEHYVAGERVATGQIVAAQFVNRGTRYRAIRHVDESGRAEYYSPAGLSMRKTFLRTPVKFTRISSRFSRARFHPVLKRRRAHRGVDYAAPTGTPVVATANGRIRALGRHGGHGRRIIVRHGGAYSTLYAHLSNYRRGLKAGARVRQGQVIGYVGRSGLATGPNLHYEFRVNGNHVNPLSFKSPKARPIAKQYRQKFFAEAGKWLAQLNTIGRQLAVTGEASDESASTPSL